MGPAAHVYASVILVVIPVVGALRARRLRAAPGEDSDRVRRYWRGLALQWLLVAALVPVSVAEGLTPAALGLRAPAVTPWALIATLAGAAVLAYLLVAVHQAATDPQLRANVRDSIGGADVVVPRTLREVRVFRLLALTAGICEELMFRGFLFLWLAAWMGLPAVVVVSSALFGLGHAYQGAAGMLKTGLVGLAFALAYVATDALWLPIALHALLDLLQGELLVRTFAHDDDAAA